MKRFFCVFLLITFIFSLSGCYSIETDNISAYQEFLDKIQSKNEIIYSCLPKQIVDEQIQEMYLYYSDYDLIDSFYCIYLNCIYDEKTYETEVERITKFAETQDYLSNVEDFKYNSLVIDQTFDFNKFNFGTMGYSYFLFDNDLNQIVYVHIFEKELNGKSSNIPDKYLPSSLINKRGNKNTKNR